MTFLGAFQTENAVPYSSVGPVFEAYFLKVKSASEVESATAAIRVNLIQSHCLCNSAIVTQRVIYVLLYYSKISIP